MSRFPKDFPFPSALEIAKHEKELRAMTLKECCDEIARLRGWTLVRPRSPSSWPMWEKGAGTDHEIWSTHPISELEDLVDYWPPGWFKAGTVMKAEDGTSMYAAMAMRLDGKGVVIDTRGHSSMFEAEAFLLLKVLQGEGVV